MSLRENGVDPRVKRTRQFLVQSFQELLMEKRFQSITVREIADRATVNRATFYAHFDDKYALLDHSIRQSFQKLLWEKLSPDSTFSLDNLRVLILSLCEYLEGFYRCESLTAVVEPIFEKELQRQIYRVVLGWVIQLQGDKSNSLTTPEVIASAISWAIFGAGVHWGRGDKKNSAEEVSDQILSLITGEVYGSLMVGEATTLSTKMA